MLAFKLTILASSLALGAASVGSCYDSTTHVVTCDTDNSTCVRSTRASGDTGVPRCGAFRDATPAELKEPKPAPGCFRRNLRTRRALNNSTGIDRSG